MGRRAQWSHASGFADAARSADDRQAEVLDGARPLRRNASLVGRDGMPGPGGTWARCARTVRQRLAFPSRFDGSR